MLQTEDINAKIFKVIYNIDDIVWDDIVEDNLDQILTSQDSTIYIVELLEIHPTRS